MGRGAEGRESGGDARQGEKAGWEIKEIGEVDEEWVLLDLSV